MNEGSPIQSPRTLPPHAGAPAPADRSALLGAAAVLVIGVIARVALVCTEGLGHLPDTNLFYDWTTGLGSLGLAGFYENRAFCDYPPLFVLVMWLIGKVTALVGGVLQEEVVVRAILKVPACLADGVIALTLLSEGRRIAGRHAGVAAAALYFLNPAAVYNSAYWGQVDAIHTALLLLGVAAVGRSRFASAGVFGALALLTKFQSIALLPLLIFDTWRCRRWRGLALMVCGAAAAACALLLPFGLTGTLDDVLSRAYVHVVGQYHQLSRNAMNLWQLLGIAELADTAPPGFIVAAVARGEPSIATDASPLLWLTYRHISLLLYAWSVAAILSLHARQAGAMARYGAAGALALAFFFIPTEMHERYAHPALAFLALWAVSAAWRERAFWFVSILLLLNLTLVLPINDIVVHTAGAMTLAFAVVCVLALRKPASELPPAAAPSPADADARMTDSVLVRAFARITWLSGLALAAATVGIVGWCAASSLFRRAAEAPGVTHVSALTPEREHQGWGTLRVDRAVSGGLIQMGDRLYLRGLGTHTPSRQLYVIPEGATQFRATVGIDGAAGQRGSAVAIVELDGEEAYRSPTLFGGEAPVEVTVPLDGAKRITLRTDATADGNRADHVSWALARFE